MKQRFFLLALAILLVWSVSLQAASFAECPADFCTECFEQIGGYYCINNSSGCLCLY